MRTWPPASTKAAPRGGLRHLGLSRQIRVRRLYEGSPARGLRPGRAPSNASGDCLYEGSPARGLRLHKLHYAFQLAWPLRRQPREGAATYPTFADAPAVVGLYEGSPARGCDGSRLRPGETCPARLYEGSPARGLRHRSSTRPSSPDTPLRRQPREGAATRSVPSANAGRPSLYEGSPARGLRQWLGFVRFGLMTPLRRQPPRGGCDPMTCSHRWIAGAPLRRQPREGAATGTGETSQMPGRRASTKAAPRGGCDCVATDADTQNARPLRRQPREGGCDTGF